MTSLLTLPSRVGLPSAPIDHSRQILCWSCATPLAPLADTASSPITCTHCLAETRRDAGIWRSLTSADSKSLTRFISEYEFIRAAEQRGSDDPGYYCALPFRDLTNKLTDQWSIRAKTFRHIERHIITPLASRFRRPLRILDLGAGNCWLSYRLALLGHQPVAVDLLTNDRDGLGAARHYSNHLPSLFPRVQATLNRLPFPDSSFDLAIFNASFHYSENFTETLAEALRCTRFSGAVVIADTPWYVTEASGRQMVAEKHQHFASTYGFASNSIDSLEFFTPQRLDDLAIALDLDWKFFKPWYGINWSLRPLRARLRGRRIPSQFRIFMAEHAQ